MAITGVVWMGYVLAHMLGNLKLYAGSEAYNESSAWLRESLVPALPRVWALHMMRWTGVRASCCSSATTLRT